MNTQIPDTQTIHFFRNGLYAWHAMNARKNMPWLKECDAYKIWLSEVILQQTTVQQGTPYYLKFVKAYPTVFDLANAPSDEVLKNWEGLGYYSRARNLIVAAKQIVEEFNGVFPNNFEDILKLKGVGNYTASAIAAYAFNLPHLAIDGNAYRVMARFFGVYAVLQSPEANKIFSELGQAILDVNNSAQFNQAMMDFGATQCTPSLPICIRCPLNLKCYAFNNGAVGLLPVKKSATAKTMRYFNYVVARIGDSVYVHQRTESDIWRDLYEFILIETDAPIEQTQETAFEIFETQLSKILNHNAYIIESRSENFIQQLTHRTVIATFWEIKLKKQIAIAPNFILVPETELQRYAFPKVILNYRAKIQKTLF